MAIRKDTLDRCVIETTARLAALILIVGLICAPMFSCTYREETIEFNPNTLADIACFEIIDIACFDHSLSPLVLNSSARSQYTIATEDLRTFSIFRKNGEFLNFTNAERHIEKCSRNKRQPLEKGGDPKTHALQVILERILNADKPASFYLESNYHEDVPFYCTLARQVFNPEHVYLKVDDRTILPATVAPILAVTATSTSKGVYIMEFELRPSDF